MHRNITLYFRQFFGNNSQSLFSAVIPIRFILTDSDNFSGIRQQYDVHSRPPTQMEGEMRIRHAGFQHARLSIYW